MTKKSIKPTESYLLLYHLYRTGIVPKSDLALYRGEGRDRYAQQLLNDHIKTKRITTVHYKQCDYCMITTDGISYLIEQERTFGSDTPVMAAYAAYCASFPRAAFPHAAISLGVQAIAQTKSKEIPSINTDDKDRQNDQMGVRSGAGGTEDDPREPGQHGNPTVDFSYAETAYAMEWVPQPRQKTKHKYQLERKYQRIAEGNQTKSLRTEIRKSGTGNLMYCAGVAVYEEDKPSYAALLQILKSPSYAKTFLWHLICEQGVFYHRSEMRSDKGTSYSNRMQGVLFTGTGWFVVYNTLGRFSRWVDSIERDNINRLNAQIMETLAYRGNPANCLVFAIGRGMVSAMVNGYAYGHNRNERLPEFIRRKQRNGLWMTVDQLKPLFAGIYLAELNSYGISAIDWLVCREKGDRRTEYVSLAHANPDAFEFLESGEDGALVEIGNGRQIILMHCYDLMEMSRLRNGTAGLTVIGPSRMAEQISKSLNARLERYISLEDGTDVRYPCFDEAGNRLDRSEQNDKQIS